MKKYYADVHIEGEKDFTICGYEGLKKIDLFEYIKWNIKQKGFCLGNKNTITDVNDNKVGYYDVYSVTC